MQQIFAAAAQMQSQFVNAQERLAETEVAGTAGGGLVKVTLNGDGELTDLVIAKEVIEPGEPEETVQTVADLVLAACRDAYRALGDVREKAMGPLAGGLLSGLGGLGGLAGMGGAPGAPGGPAIPGIPGLPGFGGLPGPSDPAGPSVEPGADEDDED
jgi:DNA-binding YbaB/EbfC family protein